MASRLVGRDAELKALASHLSKAESGKGGTVIVLGETGVGKSRLLEEIACRASTLGFKVLSGSCKPEISSAFMPFKDILKSSGMENLMAESVPKVISIYLTNNAGLLISKHEREDSALDADIFSSMLTAVNSFVADSLSMLKRGTRVESMNRLGYGNYTILIESFPNMHLAVIIEGKENEFLIQDMRDILSEIQSTHGDILKKWGGDISEVSSCGDIIARLVTSGKYEGTDFGMENPRLRQNLIMENIARGFVRSAESGPMLIILDNLQWADSPSLALLHYLARNIRNHRILILGAYRPEEVVGADAKGEHNLIETLRLMSRDELFVKIELGRLNRSGINDIITDFLGNASFPDEFGDTIYRESEGNPLFVLESLKLVMDEGVLRQTNGAWELDRKNAFRIPSKIYDIIMRRVAVLPGSHREILECASVVGLEFSSQYVESLVKMDKITILKALRELETTYHLIHTSMAGYTFDHNKTKDVVYYEIPAELRMEFHRMVGDYIETQNASNIKRFVPVLAYHYSSAHVVEKAITYLRAAADDAKKSYANREAIRLYSSLLGFMKEGENEQGRAEVLESLAEVHSICGEYEDTVACYLILLGQEPIAPHRAAYLHRKTAIALFKKGEYPKAKAELESAMNAAKAGGTELDIARVYIDMGWTSGEEREYDCALDYCTRAALILQRYPDAETDLAQLYNTVYVVSFYKNEYDNALKYAKMCLEIREKSMDVLGIAACYNAIGNTYRMKGDIKQAAKFIIKSIALLEKAGDMYGLAGAYMNMGDMQFEKGEWKAAKEWTEKSLRLSEKLGDNYNYADACNNMGNIYFSLGEYETALEWHGKNLFMREKLDDKDGIARAYMNMGDGFRIWGSLDKAIKYISKGVEMSKNVGNQMYEAYGCNLLADCYLKMRDLTKALSYANRGLEMSQKYGFVMLECASYRVLGQAHAAIKRHEDAEKYFRKSIDLCRDDDIERGRTLFEYGSFLAGKGDHGNGLEKIKKAIEIFDEKNMVAEVKAARDAASRLSSG